MIHLAASGHAHPPAAMSSHFVVQCNNNGMGRDGSKSHMDNDSRNMTEPGMTYLFEITTSCTGALIKIEYSYENSIGASDNVIFTLGQIGSEFSLINTINIESSDCTEDICYGNTSLNASQFKIFPISPKNRNLFGIKTHNYQLSLSDNALENKCRIPKNISLDSVALNIYVGKLYLVITCWLTWLAMTYVSYRCYTY